MTKQIGSVTADGLATLVVATATLGTTIHTAATGTSDLDEIWIYANNSHSAAVLLTIEWGGAAAKDRIQFTIPSKSGLNLIVPGLLLQNGKLVTAFAGTANVIGLHVFVNAIV